MKNSVAIAAVMAVASGTVGVGALDSVRHMVGSDSMSNLVQFVLSNCSALHTLGDPITFDGTGSANAENAMKITDSSAFQLAGPMVRAMGGGICQVASSVRAHAEGMVVALQSISIVGNTQTLGAEGIDYTGTAADPSNDWRSVLRLIYTGMPSSVGSNVFQRDCDSAARRAVVNDWDNVFHGVASACTDSHPSVLGTGANGYDQNNTVVEPGVRHAFRRDDADGTTDVFLAMLGLGGINYAQPAPNGSTAAQMAAYRALSGSPFCNVKRPEDKWQPIGLPANASLGLHAAQIPELSNIGVPSGAGTGLGYSALPANSSNAKLLSPYFNEYADEDPIRRKCVGRGNNANAALPMEQVCAADGTLGVILPIVVPSGLTIAQAYPSLPCDPTLGFAYGPAMLRPTGDPVRCPNGDVPQDSQCLLPVRADATQPNGVAFDCINPPLNVPAAIFDQDGDGSQFPDAPMTDGRADVDGRVYNLALRDANGAIRLRERPDPSRLGVVSTPVAGAFYRIHSTRSLLLPPDHATHLCGADDNADAQIECLTLASPCSIGIAGHCATTSSLPQGRAAINGVPDSLATVDGLLAGGPVFPFARKLYLNTVIGFEALHASDATVPNTDAEEELTKCFSTLPFSLDVSRVGLIPIPSTGSMFPRPLCEDFNGAAVCGDTSNTDACLGNETISGGAIPSSYCNNGLKDGDETAPDVCPLARPTCDPTTYHCL